MSTPGLIENESPIQRTLGFVIDVRERDGCARCWLDIAEHHLNRHGVLHGGVVSTLLDCAGGVTGSLTVDNSGITPFLTVSINVQFLASVKRGRVTAVGKLRGGGRSLLFIDSELTDENGTAIATSSGVFKRVNLPTGDGGTQ